MGPPLRVSTVANDRLIERQVTCEYCFQKGAAVPLRVHTVVVSTQHSAKISLEELRDQVTELVVKAVIPKEFVELRSSHFHLMDADPNLTPIPPQISR